VLVAGVFAGGINTVVGSGTLVTFPVLLAIGYPPVVANVSNTVGLVPGSVSGAIGYRKELAGQRQRVLRLGVASLLGGITGAVLLLTLPESAFEAIVPVLIAIALVLVVLQPRLSRMVAARRTAARPHGGPLLWTGIYGTGVYGGYFGAAQGIILLALMGIAIPTRTCSGSTRSRTCSPRSSTASPRWCSSRWPRSPGPRRSSWPWAPRSAGRSAPRSAAGCRPRCCAA